MFSLPFPRWHSISLAHQFSLAGAFVLLFGMVAIGIWVTRQIEDGVTRNTAASTALYMSSFVEPVVQELAHRDTLSAEREAELDALRQNTPLGQRIVSFKIWKEQGLIAYSSRKAIIGRTFDITENLRRAWSGQIATEFDTLVDEEDALERAQGVPLLEMYAPMRERGTGRIIAVAEFYEKAEALNANLFQAKRESWLVVGFVTLVMFGVLSGIVLRGSSTIKRQQQALEQRIGELSSLLAQNVLLRDRLQRASRQASEVNEQYLRRIGADLHDGPAQLLALAALRLDALKPLTVAQASPNTLSDVELIRESLADSLTEIRNLSAGLTLPEVDELSIRQLLESVAHAHERRTRTKVILQIESAPHDLERSLKICLYRFVQETLSNAFRHAGGAGQHVACRIEDDTLEVTVSDSGPGFDPDQLAEGVERLGLRGLRERIESIGGSLTIDSVLGVGTNVTLKFGLRG